LPSLAPSVLVVDDDDELRELVCMGLARRGCEPVGVTSAAAAIQMLHQKDFGAVIADINLPGDVTGLDLCKRLAETHPDLPVIVITGHGSMNLAIKAIRAGAYDFINKPVTIDALEISLSRAMKHRALQQEVEELRRASTEESEIILGDSPAIRRVRQQIAEVAGSDARVLIVGESGTGKELVARAIHMASRRSDGPFVAVNCAAMPASLLESELFGHIKGAFTDAKTSRQGLFAQARGGIIFLDEIGEMPLEMQPKLLRVLQEGVVRPVGGNEELSLDVRVLAATNLDLEAEVHSGRFRQDLFYRVDVVRIAVPPLRERGRDIILLAQRFLERAAQPGMPSRTLSPSVARRLMSYDWPGNVRELQNCMERVVALGRGPEVRVEELPLTVREFQAEELADPGIDLENLPTLRELERRHIVRVLRLVGGNKTRAAEVLGLDRRTLYRRLERHNLVDEP